jgi:acid phosphatase family membrane protein YuiD
VIVQNIDPIFILQPIIVIIIATGLMVYWYFKRRFHKEVWLYSLLAFGIAIALKYAVQIPTITLVTNTFGALSVGLGIYYGLQTVVFEVGLAFVVAWWAVSHGKLAKKDAEAYGAGLAFWENAVLLSALSLVNLVTYYYVLSTNSSLAQTLYNQLNTNAPGLFAPASEALRSVALGIIERISSIMIHVAWGYLCLMAVMYHNKRLFLIALPMGFIDFLVPFAQGSVVGFETAVFALSVLSVVVAWYATIWVRKNAENRNLTMVHDKELVARGV